MNILSKKITTTLAYYDVMDYPMTAFEVWKYLIVVNPVKSSETLDHGAGSEQEKIRLVDITKELESEEVKKHIDQYRGYYFLKGRRGLVIQRIERNKIAEKKFKTTRRVVWLLRFVPYVRMVAATGTLAMKNTQRKSDLDLLIVLKHGHIFTGRTLVTLVTHLMGVRRYGDKISNRICLNFFITSQSLKTDLREIFTSEPRSNMEVVAHFSASEHFFILPIFDLGNFEKFQEENLWIKKYLENFQPENIPNSKKIPDGIVARMIRNFGEWIFLFSLIEKKLKKWQTGRIARDSRTHLPGSLVLANDNYLIFLPESQGEAIFERFQNRLGRIS